MKLLGIIDEKVERPWGRLGIVFVVATILAGISYTVLQLVTSSETSDLLFVGISMGNTFAVYRFSAFLKSYLLRTSVIYQEDLRGSALDFSSRQFINDIFNSPGLVICAVAYGAFFFAFTIYLSPSHEELIIKANFGFFMFLVNTVVGMAIYSLFVYFNYSLKIGRHIEIELWDRSNAALNKLIDTNRHILLATAFVACLGMLSLLGSKFELNIYMALFSAFSIFLIFLAYVIPLIPITTKIRKKKKMNINKLGALIQKEYLRILEQGEKPSESIDISRFDSLSKIYVSVKSIRTFPPVGEFSLNTAFFVTFLTIFPSLMDFIFN
jgi:hypothetical protein